MKLNASDAATALGGNLTGQDQVEITRVSTDSRTLQPGDCFVAIRGERFDGHEYAAMAAERGATVLILEQALAGHPEVTQIIVNDTTQALGDLANAWRHRLAKIPSAAIVGSSGKTTTKEMAATILSAKFSTLVTTGNLNNLIGLPHMMFRLEEKHQVAIFELGMNTAGELRRLVEIVEPQCVALTNITNAHIGMFGSQEALFEAKADSLRWSRDNATLVINTDDPWSLRAHEAHGRSRPVIFYGTGERADVRIAGIRPLEPFGYSFTLFVYGKPYELRLHTFGRHNVMNAACAAAIATFFGVEPAQIAASLEAFRPGQNRSEVEEIDGWYLVKDYYNASPAAMEQALKSLGDFAVPGKRIVVLGDMMELGRFEEQYHAAIGRLAAQAGVDQLYCVGERARMICYAALAAGLTAEHLPDAETAAHRVKASVQAGDLVLIKGSRLMKLERVYEILKG